MSATRKMLPAEIHSDPNIMGGEPCVRGTRIPARTILLYIKAGRSDFEIFDDYPSLPVDGIKAVREWHAAGEPKV